MRKKPALKAIPTDYLPKGWAQKIAEEYQVSSSLVEKIVYGIATATSKNKEVWNYILSLAEAGKADAEKEEQTAEQRLKALAV